MTERRRIQWRFQLLLFISRRPPSKLMLELREQADEIHNPPVRILLPEADNGIITQIYTVHTTLSLGRPLDPLFTRPTHIGPQGRTSCSPPLIAAIGRQLAGNWESAQSPGCRRRFAGLQVCVYTASPKPASVIIGRLCRNKNQERISHRQSPLRPVPPFQTFAQGPRRCSPPTTSTPSLRQESSIPQEPLCRGMSYGSRLHLPAAAS